MSHIVRINLVAVRLRFFIRFIIMGGGGGRGGSRKSAMIRELNVEGWRLGGTHYNESYKESRSDANLPAYRTSVLYP
jgi:hypothetical protein